MLGVIPARFASTRFPGKALARIAGKTMLQHVWERSSQASTLSKIIIATDDQRIFDEAERFGAEVRMTRATHASGTDRAAEVAAHEDVMLVVNIQGDEPLIDPAAIDAAVKGLLEEGNPAPMGTLRKRIEDPGDLANPNVVKVITDLSGNAIYFSRSPIPYLRAARSPQYKHIGLYVYRRDFLLGYSLMPVGPLEQAESLEQLRALENGHRIRVVETQYESLGVDTPEDLERVSEVVEAKLMKS
ncbi:MAG: 3-deoxy-manno-octulosonate cytidylyltransferase [Bryobacteraceae bacterium]